MTINRRQMLTRSAFGLGGATLSPLMSSVLAQIQTRASGANRPPMRFVFLVKANGLWAENIQPQGFENRLPFRVAYDDNGRLLNGNHGAARKNPTPAANVALGADDRLSTVMAALQPFRDRISILQGLAAGFPVYHDGHYQALGAFAARRRDTPEAAGPTIDSILAQAFAGPVRHVCLGYEPQAASGVAYVTTSAEDNNKPISFYTKPQRAYKALFGVVDQGDARAEYETQSDILDFFAQDAQRLRTEIAGPERDQLDRYLNAFESVRQSRRRVEAMRDQLRRHAPQPPGEIEAQATSRVGAANIDIAVAALASGLTNVVTISFDRLGSSSYGSFGTGGLHGSVGHGQGGQVLQKRQRICQFHFEQMARLARSLQSIPEGDGTMLDNTLIVYTSNNGETHHSSGVNWPVVLLGDLGGRMQKGHYFAPGNDPDDRQGERHVRLGDLWATLLAAAGQSYRGFGRPRNGAAHRPIAALMV